MATRRAQAAPLDLEVIVETAAELIAEEGFDALTMRRLAERCGVTAMSLYRYVQTKEDLLIILANRALADLDLPEPGTLPWQEEISVVLRSLHRLLLAHPEFVTITGAQPIDTLVAYRGMELVLGTLQREGLDDEEAVTAYDVLVSFSRGFIQQHAGRRGELPPFQRLSTMRELQAEDFPHVVKLAGRLVTRDPDKHFEDGLKLVIRGIEDQLEEKRAADA
jgi:AcrR family transcriptional regulator